MGNAEGLDDMRERGVGRGLLIAMLILIMILAAGSVLVLRLNQKLVDAEVESRLGPIRKSLDEVKPALERIKNLDTSLRRLPETEPELPSNDRISALGRRQDQLERKVQADLQSLRGSLAQLTDLEERLGNIQNRLDTQAETIGKISAGLDRSGEGIQKDLRESLARLKAVEESLQEHQTIVREVQRALQRSKSDREIEDALAGVNSRLKDLESRLGSRVLTVEGRAGTLERKLDALERQLLQLQAQPARP